MDFSGIQGMLEQQQQQTLMYLNDSGNVILTDNGQQGVYGDMFYHDYTPVQSADTVFFLDENGILREGYQDLSSSTFILSQDLQAEDDGEIPPHVLDHMYAKKPREPGTEQATPKPRRRSKRKEQVVEQQYVMPEPQPQTPKINIIRQHLPTSMYKSISPSRPKILQGSNTKGGGSQSPNYSTTSPTKDTHRQNMSGSPSSGSTRTMKKEDPLSQGMYVTFEDDGSRNTLTKGSPIGNGLKFGKEQYYNNKTLKPFMSKASSNTIIMDELQSKPGGATGYEEEMLFDFGISEDDDEVNRCTLAPEEFGDVVFDECEFESGLDVNIKDFEDKTLTSKPLCKSVPVQEQPMRRSMRAVKTPAWLDDSTDSQFVKRKRR